MKHLRYVSARGPCPGQSSLSVLIEGILALVDILVVGQRGKAWGIPRPYDTDTDTTTGTGL